MEGVPKICGYILKQVHRQPTLKEIKRKEKEGRKGHEIEGKKRGRRERKISKTPTQKTTKYYQAS